MNVFHCTRYRVDLARKWHASSECLVIPQKIHHKRSRLDQQKCEHFIEWILGVDCLWGNNCEV